MERQTPAAPAPEPAQAPEHDSTARPLPRLRRPDRSRLPDVPLDVLLPEDDLARLLWPLVERLDFSPWLADVKAVQGHPGRDANDPRLLFCLWLLATLDGVGSARRLEELCYGQLSYMWLRGGVGVNYSSLAAFRVSHPDRLQRMLGDCVGAMLAEGLISLEQTAQDGLRVRASAGAGSFRRRATLEEARRQAEAYLEQVRQQGDEEAATPRQAAARLRAARERLGRLEGALGHLGQLERQREGLRPDLAESRGKHEPRASTTDPECRKMKMPDGGYRPGYNAQLDTAVQGGVIVAVDVTNEGTDYAQVLPMLGQVEGQGLPLPEEHLVDGGFASKDEIEAVAEAHPGVKLYAPVKDAARQEAQGKDPYRAKKGDGPAVAAWRARMGTEEGKGKYKLRAQTAEWANAQLRNRGLYQVRVRGLAKVKAVLLWHALAHDLTRWLALRAAALAKAS
jgi:transposase